MSPTTSTPAWRPDPAGRHAYRYFDGERWTEHVSDGRTQGIDRLPEHLPKLDPLDLVIPGRDIVFLHALAQRPQTASVAEHFALASIFFVGLVLVSVGLLGASCHTSARAAAMHREAMIAGLEVKAISAEAPDPADLGRLVHVSGLARAERPVVDDETGVSTNALFLERNVSMYQWIETCTRHDDRPLAVGPDVHVDSDVRRPTAGRMARGTVVRWTRCTYTKGWKDQPQAIRSERIDRYGNPPFPFEAGTHRHTPSVWSLGKLELRSDLLPNLPTAELQPIPLTPEHVAGVPGPLRAQARIDGNTIHVGDPGAPKVGDLRITYVGRTEMTLTLVGERAGRGLRPRSLPDGTEFYQAREGALSIADLAGQRRQDAPFGWVGHVVFAAFVLFGTLIAFWPVRTWGRALPGPALLTGAGVLLFVPLSTTVLYTTILALVWWVPDRGAALLAAGVAGVAGLLLLTANAARELLRSRPFPAK